MIFNKLCAYLAWALAFFLKQLSPKKIKFIILILSRICTPVTLEEAIQTQKLLKDTFPSFSGLRNCLQYSLTTTVFLIFRRKIPTWCVGIKTQPPFYAHAWIEVDGMMIGERLPSNALTPLIQVKPKK